MITPTFIAPQSADRSPPSADPVAGMLADETSVEALFECLLTDAASSAAGPTGTSVFAPRAGGDNVSVKQPQLSAGAMPAAPGVPADSPVVAEMPVTRTVRNVAARVMSLGADAPAVSADPVGCQRPCVNAPGEAARSGEAGSPATTDPMGRREPADASDEPSNPSTGRDEPPAELLAMFAFSRLIPAEPEAIATATPAGERHAARSSLAASVPSAPAARMRDHGVQPVSIFVGQTSAGAEANPALRISPTGLVATSPEPSAAGKSPDPVTPSFSQSVPAASAALAADDTVSASPAPAAAVVLNTVRASVAAEPMAVAEKNAATVIQPQAGSLSAKVGPGKNNFLNAADEADAVRGSARGIVNAKVATDMPVVSKNPMRDAAPAAPSAGPVAAAELASLSPAGLIGLPADTAVAEVVDASALHATDAADAVRQVVDIVHEFRDRDRGSVEVKFDFADDAGLTVRVDLRGDELRTTFRTDSDELRSALGREWQGFAAGLANETRGHRVADPVFTASGNDTGSQAGHDAHGRQNFSGHDQTAGRHAAFAGGATRSSARGAPAAVPSATPRVSTNRLLQAFA